jgi:prevent-host-death family protein
MRNRQVTATELKSKCLALLDEVDQRGDIITVTKRGRAVAVLQPAKRKTCKPLKGAWVGKVEITGEIVSNDASEFWEALRRG